MSSMLSVCFFPSYIADIHRGNKRSFRTIRFLLEYLMEARTS